MVAIGCLSMHRHPGQPIAGNVRICRRRQDAEPQSRSLRVRITKISSRGSNALWEPGGRSTQLRSPVLSAQEFGELLGVDLSVVAAPVVEQHMGMGGVPGQAAHLGRSLCQLGFGVATAKPLADVLAVPLMGACWWLPDCSAHTGFPWERCPGIAGERPQGMGGTAVGNRGLFWPAVAALTVFFAVTAVATASASPGGSGIVGTGAAGGPTVRISEATVLHPVPHAYLGFSIEPANLCHVVQLAQTDPAFVQLFRDVGPGIFRVGGNTGDGRASWSTTATSPACVWNGLVVTPSLVTQFFAFARSVGYKVAWQAPLGNSQYAMDAAEAAYVSKMPGAVSVDFGNEPNKYPNARTEYLTYIADWDTVYRDYLADGGTAPVTGPSTAARYTWYITPFLRQEASHLAALTAHWYAGPADTHPTCLGLLAAAGTTAAAIVVSQASAFGLPGVINETNTYYGQGMPGVSNAYCSALWAADQTMNGLAAGLQGMYFHGTANYAPGNSLGLSQYYTPINEDGTPAPEFYGLLFWQQMASAGGSQVMVRTQNATGLDAYAVTGSDGRLRLALVNRGSTSITVAVQTSLAYTKASEISLTGPSLSSLSGITLGDTAVAADGTWTPHLQPVIVNGTSSTITVPAYTGMITTYSP